MSVLFNLAVWVAPGIPDDYRPPLFVLTLILLFAACVWWWKSGHPKKKVRRTSSKREPKTISASDVTGSNIATAGRDVHQTIYHGTQHPPASDANDDNPLLLAHEELKQLLFKGERMMSKFFTQDSLPNSKQVLDYIEDVRKCVRRRIFDVKQREWDRFESPLDDEKEGELHLKQAALVDAELLPADDPAPLRLFGLLYTRIERLRELLAFMTGKVEQPARLPEIPTARERIVQRETGPRVVPPKVPDKEWPVYIEPRYKRIKDCIRDASQLLRDDGKNGAQELWSFNAICRSGADQLHDNSEVVEVCEALRSHGYDHPFKGIEPYVLQDEYLQFVTAATHRSLRLDMSGDYLLLAGQWPKERGRPEPTTPIPRTLTILGDVLRDQGIGVGEIRPSRDSAREEKVLSALVFGTPEAQQHREAQVTDLVARSLTAIRGSPNMLPLYALQTGGAGSLETEQQFLDACETLHQRHIPHPLKNFGDIKVGWLKLIRFANQEDMSLSSDVAVYDCLQAYFTSLKPPS